MWQNSKLAQPLPVASTTTTASTTSTTTPGEATSIDTVYASALVSSCNKLSNQCFPALHERESCQNGGVLDPGRSPDLEYVNV